MVLEGTFFSYLANKLYTYINIAILYVITYTFGTLLSVWPQRDRDLKVLMGLQNCSDPNQAENPWDVAGK